MGDESVTPDRFSEHLLIMVERGEDALQALFALLGFGKRFGALE